MQRICLFLAFLSVQSVADIGKTLEEDLSRFISSTKVELAQSFLGPTVAKKDVTRVSITEERNGEINFVGTRQSAALFRRSKDNFIVSGSKILQLRKTPLQDGGSDKYFLDPVHEFSSEEGAILFQQAEWNNIFFLAVCYRRNYCRALMSHPATSITFRQRLTIPSTPTDIEFFAEDEALFLIVAGDPCKIYRWTGAYFDEHEDLETSGARAVAVFRNMDTTVIVVAQNLQIKEVYSKVFVRRSRKTELIQMLQTKEASDVVPYSLDSGNETIHFVFVLNNRDESAIFWWNGREFSLWKRVENVVGPGRIYVHTMLSEIFFFFSHQNKLSVYHPTEMTFDLVHFMEFDRDIFDVDLREEDSHSPMLLLLKGTDLEPLLTIALISVDINYVPIADDQIAIDPVLQCLFQLKNTLHDREAKLNESVLLSNKIAKKSSVIELDRLTVPELELKSFKINDLRVNPLGKELEATPTEIRKKLEKLRQESNSLLAKMESTLKQVHYRFHGNIVVGRMKASNIYVKKFNDRTFDLHNIVSVAKNQTLSGTIRLKTLSVNTLTVPCVNGVYVKDFLLRNKSLQEIMGEHTVRSMKARNVVFGRLGKLNGTLFSRIRRFDDEVNETSLEEKSIRRITLKQLQVEYINSEPAEEWLAKILPSIRDFDQEEALNFTNLKVTHLTVGNINGSPWQNYFTALERFTWNDTKGTGNRLPTEITKARHLRAKKINGIQTKTFLTKETRQAVHSTIAATSATLHQPKARIFICGRNLSSPEPVQNKESSQPLFVPRIIFSKYAQVSGRSVHFDSLNKTYWMKSWTQEVGRSVTFANQVKVKDLGTPRINNETVEGFVTANEARTIKGRMVFEDANVFGNVATSSGARRDVNLDTLYRSAVKRDGENRVKGRKIFVGNVLTKRYSFKSLNGITSDYTLPIATGIIRAQQVEIVGDVSAKNGVRLDYLNGHRFNDIVTKHVRLSQGNILEHANFSSLSVKEIRVENVNGVGGVNRFKSRKWSTTRMVIRGDLKLREINVTTVNGLALNDYMNAVVLRNGTASIVKGRKQFHKVVTVRGNLDGALNGYNLAELEGNALSKSKSQKITGTFVVDVLNVNNADGEVIDGVPSADLLFQDGFPLQTINSRILFADLAIVGNIKSQHFMDNCDLSGMSRLKVNEIRKIGKLDVMGNVTWNSNRVEYKGISHLYVNSVTKHNEQVIQGSVTFQENTAFDKLTTKSNINGVDLEFIVKDAVFRSPVVQEIFQDITFKGKVTTNNVLIENNIIVDNVNGIDILDFGQKLVRNNVETEVRGKKKFLAGFSTLRFTAGAVNGAKTDPIIFCDGGTANETIAFPATSFHSVKTLNDLNVLRVNQVNLSNLLKERLSKTGIQEVNSILRIEGPVSIKGNAGISRINNLRIKDTVLISGEIDTKSITGKIEFNNTVSATENLKLGELNHHNVTEVHERALLNARDSVIEGNIVFKEDVEFRGNVDALQGVKTCETKNVRPVQVPTHVGYNETSYSGRIAMEIDKIQNSSSSLTTPIIFVDLLEKTKLNLELLKVQKTAARYRNDNVELDIYGFDDDERCPPRGDCYCAGQRNLLITSSVSNGFTFKAVFPICYKYFDESMNVEVTVTVPTASYDSRCDGGVDTSAEYATMNWRRRKSWSGGNDPHERQEMANFTGHLSDVEFFKMGPSIFVVMAFYIPPMENKMSRLNIIVHEFDGRKETMRKIQEMEMSGVEALDLFWTPKGVVLVAGNGYDSDIFADSVDSAIYRFCDSNNQFQLLRSVKTHGILDIASIRGEKDNFIFLVQKQSWPFLILKYNHEYDNYYFSQKLYADQSRVKSNFLSAAAFTIARSGYEGDIFVGIVHSDGGFRLFKYKYIEGFVEELRQEQKNIEMLMPFRVDSRQYLLAASSGNHSVIYELLQQGYMRSNQSIHQINNNH